MLSTVAHVGDGIVKDLGERKFYTLENIVCAVEAYSPIDEIIYTSYNVPSKNPIWGQFWKYGRQPSTYSSFKTTVEIRYASHLSAVWRRFVVCKEICHSLEADEGTHSFTDKAIERLVGAFSLSSAGQPKDSRHRPMQAELLAEAGAIELLIPYQVRSRNADCDISTSERLCREYGIPEEYSYFAFSSEIMESVRLMTA